MNTTGAVTISPSGVVTVCNGDQRGLTCAITDSGASAILVWNVTVISVPVAISSSIPTNQAMHRTVDSTNITFSRVSPQNSSPLVSRLVMNPVSIYLNGTQVNCVDSLTSESSSVAVINVSNGNPIQGIRSCNFPHHLPGKLAHWLKN